MAVNRETLSSWLTMHAQSVAILILSKVAPVVTASMYSWWGHLLHVNAVQWRHYGLCNVKKHGVFSHASWK